MVIDLTTDLENREGGSAFGQPVADDLMDSFHGRGEWTREGLIKMKLAHARGFTVLLPNVLRDDRRRQAVRIGRHSAKAW